MTEAKALALYTPVPVAIHMWFADGAGWAFHPDIGETMLEEIVRTVTPDLYSSKSDTSVLRECGAGSLVIEKSRQEQCADPRATERSPHILRVAVLPVQAKDVLADTDESGSCDEISHQLKNLSAPTKRGQSDLLRIWLAVAEPELQAPPEAAARGHVADDLERENAQLKQDISDLRRANERLRKAIPTRRQRLATTFVILVVSAVLTTVILFLAGLLPRFQ